MHEKKKTKKKKILWAFRTSSLFLQVTSSDLEKQWEAAVDKSDQSSADLLAGLYEAYQQAADSIRDDIRAGEKLKQKVLVFLCVFSFFRW
jgi:hypothetical protein